MKLRDLTESCDLRKAASQKIFRPIKLRDLTENCDLRSRNTSRPKGSHDLKTPVITIRKVLTT